MTSSPPSPSLSPFDSALHDIQLAPFPSPLATFSQLPFELVEEIVHSTVPPHYQSGTYSERQETLLSLSLVCRTFHEIAKPLLFAVTLVRQDIDTTWWEEWQEEDPSFPCRELIIEELEWPNENKLPRVKPLMQAHLQLKVLVLAVNKEEICLADLSCLTNLSVLRLSGTNLIGDRTFIFPKLRELSIDELASASSLPWGGDRARFPALRALDSYWLHYPHHDILEHLITMLPEQLELLNIQEAAIVGPIASMSSATLDKIKHKTVFWVESEHFTLQPVRFLRLNNLVITATAVDQVKNFTSGLFKSPIGSLPSVLYLPIRINPANWGTENTSFIDASEILLSKCRENKIEVVFEENEWVPGYDSPFSADFCRRMEKERSEKEGVAK